MNFLPHLEAICSQVEGALACCVMGTNGLPVEQHRVARGDIDLEGLWVEYSSLFGQIERAGEAMHGGGLTELAIHTDRVTTLVRIVTPEYFLALALAPDGNVGKGRFALRVTAPRLLSELA
jgi:predicted regulator of Ras-like GTPase activity (Roadblock/LC7/MglB family)